MCNTKAENTPFYKKPEWYLEKFTPVVIVIAAAGITSFFQGTFNKAWIIAVIGYIIAIFAAMGISVLVTNHYNKHHNIPEKCREAIEDNCNSINKLRDEYNEAINRLNSKVSDQEHHINEVNKLINSAEKLEKIYSEAVAKKLRTNKQIADIESKARKDSYIYIMTSSFMLETYNDDMRQSIAQNIVRGVKYRYIIPNNKTDEFKEMVYAIMCEIQDNTAIDDKSIIELDNNEYLTAVQIAPEYIMLTVAYYDLGDPDWSEVIVKLPADTMKDVTDQEPLAYLVPRGEVQGAFPKKYNSEHKVFLDGMKKIYQDAKKSNNELAFKKTTLLNVFKSGLKISANRTILLKRR